MSSLFRQGALAKRFARDEDGAAIIEAVLWIPFFFGILMLITDASLGFFSKAETVRIVEIGNRIFSVESDATVAGTQKWIEDQLAELAPNAKVTTTVNTQDNIVSTTVQYPARDVMPFNTLGALGGWTITVRARQYVERDI